jgi:hypothetical protein
MTVQDLKDLSPFLAVIASVLALSVGPYLGGRVARIQTIAGMREKWIYAFRDCLVQLTTEFDVLHETIPESGIMATDECTMIVKRLRTLANTARLMVNKDEQLYIELLVAIEETISMLVHGIDDFDAFHKLNEHVKAKAQEAILSEWGKIAL